MMLSGKNFDREGSGPNDLTSGAEEVSGIPVDDLLSPPASTADSCVGTSFNVLLNFAQGESRLRVVRAVRPSLEKKPVPHVLVDDGSPDSASSSRGSLRKNLENAPRLASTSEFSSPALRLVSTLLFRSLPSKSPLSNEKPASLELTLSPSSQPRNQSGRCWRSALAADTLRTLGPSLVGLPLVPASSASMCLLPPVFLPRQLFRSVTCPNSPPPSSSTTLTADTANLRRRELVRHLSRPGAIKE